MLNLILFIDALIVISLLVLSVIVLLNGGYKRLQNVFLTLFSILIAIWIPANHIGNDTGLSPDLAQAANYFVFASSFGAMILVMLFAVRLAAIQPITRLSRIVLPFLLLMFVLSATPLVGAGVERQQFVYGVVFGPLVIPYGISLLFMITVTLVAVSLGLRRTRGIRKNQLQVIGSSLAIALPLVLTIGFILPSISGMFWLTEFGVMPLVIIVAALYYSVIRHRLFDIRFVVVRSVAYGLVLASLSIVYYVLAYIVSVVVLGGHTTDAVSVSPVNIALALFLTIIFQPIKLFFDRITNNYFYKEEYKSDEFFARLSHLLASTTDLRGLLERVSVEIVSTLKSEQVFFFLHKISEGNHHISSGTNHHSKLPPHDAGLLDEYATKSQQDIILTDTLPEKSPIRRMLLSHKISIAVVLKNSKQIIGYVMLGEHLSSNYTKRDLRVLSTISNELVIAIQNAISLQEVKELNATLQQRIDVATKELRSSNEQLKHLDEVKDEFISMASHQLRTPLTSVKGYISMVLDGDVGKVSPQQEKLLTEAFNSSERMVRLIADFLNVSRLQTGKFVVEKQAVDIKSIIKQEIDNLKVMAASRSVALSFMSTRSELPIVVDEAKIRQVVMNFVDNAIYYSPPNTEVHVSLERDQDELVFMVVDAGIGVPKSEQSRLFNKFFRAKNARKQRPDGTGIGLYLARRVITAHDGKIIFHSEEGKGSTFGFRLPLGLGNDKVDNTDQTNDDHGSDTSGN